MPSVYKLQPTGKDYLWGGHRLKEEFGKQFDLDPVAESWECSTHPDGMSRLADGTDPARTLQELLLAHPSYLGTHPSQSMPEAAARGEIPILVKFIDAARDLSVQVHPDDDYARTFEDGQLGKTEMWYVLDAEEGAELIYGFRRDMTPERVREIIARDRLEAVLQKVPVQRDDVYFVKAGTVHAIGAGCLIVEVQESSNLTYRLYDYHRKGADGRERELHIDKALAVMNYRASTAPRQPMRVLRYRPGYASEFLCRCKYFEVRRILIHTEDAPDPSSKLPPYVQYDTDSASFHVLICIDGDGVIFCTDTKRNPEILPDRPGKKNDENADSFPKTDRNHGMEKERDRGSEGQKGEASVNAVDVRLEFSRGDTLFIPAGTTGLCISGSAAFLDVNC